MRDFRDAKVMAHSLRDALKTKAMEITHSESLELIAKTFGYENWNILSAKIDTAQPRSGAAAGHHGSNAASGPLLFLLWQEPARSESAGCRPDCVHLRRMHRCVQRHHRRAIAPAYRRRRGRALGPCPPKGCCIMLSTPGRESNAIVSCCSVSNECLHFDATRHRWMTIF